MKSATLESGKPQRFLLHEADWKQYVQLRRSLDERGQHAFVTFDGHRIELMSPSFEHGRTSEWIGQLVRCIARVTQTKYVAGGSTTFKRRKRMRGLEPDKCFWIANQAAIREIKKIDLRINPPPDLAIEVEVSRRLLDRKAIYARLGVPEIWVYNGKVFRMLKLNDEQQYEPAGSSLAFPAMRFAGVERVLQRASSTDELEWQAYVETWVRKSLAK